MQTRITCIVFPIIYFILIGFSARADQKIHSFGVADSFALTRLYGTDGVISKENNNPFYFSPDNRRVFLVTGAGDARDKTYIFRLMMFNTSDLVDYLYNDNSYVPSPTVLAEIKYDQRSSSHFGFFNSAGIKNIKFHEPSETVLFIGADDNGIYQLFGYSVKNKKLFKLTNFKKSVIEYVINKHNGEIIFTVSRHESEEFCRNTTFRPLEMTFMEAFCLPSGQSYLDYQRENFPLVFRSTVNVYRINPEPGSASVLLAAGIKLMSSLSEASLSPDGLHIALRLFSKEPPKYLQNNSSMAVLYERIMTQSRWGFKFDSAYHRKPGLFSYYGIVRLTDGQLYQLYDWPIVENNGKSEVEWISSNKLQISNVLSLKGDRSFVSTELNEPLHAGSVILDLVFPKPVTDSLAEFSSAVFTEREADPPRFKRQERQLNEQRRCEFVLNGKDITEDGKPACYVDNNNLGIRLFTGESLTSPPNVLISDLRGNNIKRLIDLNPQLRSVALGPVKKIKWSDENDIEWEGALVLPPSYRSGQRYPLVVQTNGYDPNSFMVDGVWLNSPPYAAQALASRGIMVLQIPEKIDPKSDYFSSEAFKARGINSAIRRLHKDGLVDLNKIGLTGYSSTGQFVFKMATFPEFVPQAIIIADGFSTAPLGYANTYNSDPPGLEQIEYLMCNSMPWGDTQEEWIRRNPYYHLDKLRTAVLFERNSPDFIDWWEVITGMRRLKKPVDLYFFTAGGHPLKQAESVLIGQELSVDWFDFWLNGAETPGPEKREQYERWRQLREWKKASHSSPVASVPLSKMDCPKKRPAG